MTENLFSHPFSHPAESDVDTTATAKQESTEPVTMPEFSHLGQ